MEGWGTTWFDARKGAPKKRRWTYTYIAYAGNDVEPKDRREAYRIAVEMDTTLKKD